MNGPTVDDPGAVAATPDGQTATGPAAWLLLGLWLLGTAGAFWFFELGGESLPGITQQSFVIAAPAPIEAWYRERVAADTTPGALLTLVRLHGPRCACDRDMAPALRSIEAEFQPRGVRFLDTADDRLRAAGVTASPAALVFDAAGRLVYYGPYSNSPWSDSAWCGGGGRVIERLLERALRGEVRFATSPVARGCFCTA